MSSSSNTRTIISQETILTLGKISPCLSQLQSQLFPYHIKPSLKHGRKGATGSMKR